MPKDSIQAIEIAAQVAREVREAVRPALETRGAADVAGVAASGDTTYAADLLAEEAVERAARDLQVPVLLYTEDRGLQQIGSEPHWLLVVDPIDGTRPASCGFEACTVSVAVAPPSPEATVGDVVAGAVYELRRDHLFCAASSSGAYAVEDGIRRQLCPRPPRDFGELRWTLETVARPAVPNFVAASGLIDQTSLKGSLFAFNSSAFVLCQIADGWLSGMVDLSGRLLADLPNGEELCRGVGDGRVMGMWAYDIAAAALIASEAGCTVTDAWGRPLAGLPLTRTEPRDMASCICAAGSAHHARMLELLDSGFRELTRSGTQEASPGV